jgi:pyridoxamine 5'-phosphate oxidase
MDARGGPIIREDGRVTASEPLDPTGTIAAMRRSYEAGGLSEDDLAPTWFEQFQRWFAAATAAGLTEPNAMVLATASDDGRPTARTVLCKGVDERGVVLYTNLESTKGVQALGNPYATVLFPWHLLQRQVIVSGTVVRASEAEADGYFASRPYGSQVGAWASPQSSVIASRAEIEQIWAQVSARYPEGTPVPRPPHWGGLRIVPESVEFWQGRRDRLHDRLRFRRVGDDWSVERLAP